MAILFGFLRFIEFIFFIILPEVGSSALRPQQSALGHESGRDGHMADFIIFSDLDFFFENAFRMPKELWPLLAALAMVMSINPLYLSNLFNNHELDEACKHMHAIYTEIIEDATL